MPIYEYKCNGCGHLFSRLQSIGATSEGIRCPMCRADDVERQLSGFAAGGSKTEGASCAAGSPAPCGSGFS